MRAAWEGRAEFVKSLLASGADATIRSPAGDTALALARRRERTEVVALLEAAEDR
jgi:ankyrin repeat protein